MFMYINVYICANRYTRTVYLYARFLGTQRDLHSNQTAGLLGVFLHMTTKSNQKCIKSMVIILPWSISFKQVSLGLYIVNNFLDTFYIIHIILSVQF